jgi:hypothetical protein
MQRRQQWIPGGLDGLREKARALRQLVDDAKSDPVFRQRAIDLVARAGVRERDVRGELAAVSSYVRRVRYQADPQGVELFTDPRILVGQLEGSRHGVAAGDCDDLVGLGAALLESLGRRTRFVVGGDAPADGGRHIWLEVQSPRGWLALDDTVRSRSPGWSPAPAFASIGTERVATLAAPVYGSRMARPAARPRICYGGAGSLQGFSLKKVVRKVEKTVARVVPAPVKKVAAAIKPVTKAVFTPLQKLTYDIPQQLLKKQFKLVAPLAPAAANIVVPGSGIVVDALQRGFANDQAPTSSQPFAIDREQLPPPVMMADPLRSSYAGGGGDYGPGAQLQTVDTGSSYWPWVAGALAVAAGFLFLRRRR